MTVQEMAVLIIERVRISEAAAIAAERLRIQAEAMRVVGAAIDRNAPALAPALAQVGHELLRVIENRKEAQPS